MKVYVCPICDHAMTGKHYCHNCHQFVSNPYYMERNYSLDRAAESEIRTEPELEAADAKEGMENKKKQETDTQADRKKKHQKIKPQRTKPQRTGKRHYHLIWLLVIYLLFQIGIFMYSNIPENIIDRIKNEVNGMFSEKNQPEEDIGLGEGSNIEISSDWSYQTPDYDEILEKGKESTGFTHFAVSGKEFTEKIHRILNDADFDVIESAEHMENYIAFNSAQSEEYSYFQSIQTFYLTEDFTEYYRISKDSVSERLIDTEIESSDFDQVCFFVRAAASILFPDNKKKQKKAKKLDSYLERLLGEETYFSERIGTMVISGYTYTSQDKNRNKTAFHISLSRAENA